VALFRFGDDQRSLSLVEDVQEVLDTIVGPGDNLWRVLSD